MFSIITYDSDDAELVCWISKYTKFISCSTSQVQSLQKKKFKKNSDRLRLDCSKGKTDMLPHS